MNHFVLTVLLAFSGAIRFAEGSVCDPNPCKNRGVCQIPDQGYNWGYFCSCPSEYHGAQCQWDGNTCDAATKTPCQNGGECYVTQDGRFCKCPGETNKTIRYGGHYCEIVDPCASCPTNTEYCCSAANVISGRLCLNDKHMEID